jgi:glycosyltransferase involved in cell wall biosynthesis
MRDVSKLKVAIVQDWLVGGGSEQVVLELHRMFPDAPIYTSYATDEWRHKLDGKVITGYLQSWPFSRLRKYLPVLRIWWFSRLKLEGFDLVISSSGNGEAKGVKVLKGTTHICYCHTPTHFYWRQYNQYVKHPGFGGPFTKVGLRLLVDPLRKWDLKASKRPDYFIANSNHIKNDIKKYYGRDAVVIHPPVDVERYRASKQESSDQRKGFICVGRQVPYKRFDLIVDACNKLELPLTVIGNGPVHYKLIQRAGASITFIERASNEEVARELASADAFIMAALEDFGITSVEAMAAGNPVIAYKAGGALDYVVPEQTGVFFSEQNVDSLVKALKEFKPESFDRDEISKYANQFSASNFREQMEQFISQLP